MSAKVGMLGFRGDVQESEDLLSWAMNYDEALPEVSVVAVLLDNTAADEEAIRRRRVDITKALDRGATLVLVVGPGGQAGASTPLGSWLLSTLFSPLGLSLSWTGGQDLTSERVHLRAFFQEQMAYAHLSGNVPGSAAVLARVRPGGTDSLIASFHVSSGRAAIYVLPLRSTRDAEEETLRFIRLTPPDDEYPDYLDSLDLGNEAGARAALQELQERREELEGELSAARRTKRILYFRDMALQEEVVRHLNEELGVPARLIAGNKEDFHLVSDGTDDPWCVGEVKGRDSIDVRKSDVNQLTINRGEAGFPDDFPSLLVVSTYRQRLNLAERDVSLHPDVIRRAAEDHVVVVRTLDLVRVTKALRAGDARLLEDLLSALKGGGGWFEVTDSGEHRLRQR
jgi:hypothetical protein